MKLNSIKILFAIIMMMAGITAQAANVITMTTSKKVGERIFLRITANGDYTVSGADGSKLTSSTITITGDVTSLTCSDDSLTSLDVSGDTLLTGLDCYNNSLTSLDVSGDTLLTGLDCYNNRLTSLDLSKNDALITLACENNSLTSINVSNCNKLNDLVCYNNSLTSLDLSTNKALVTLYCYNNSLTDIDVSNCNKLKRIYCYGNNLDRESMDKFVSRLVDRNGTEAGTIKVYDPKGDNNKIFMTHTTAMRAKNWSVQTKDGVDYEELSAFTFTTKRAVGSVLSCGITLGRSTALLMKGATYSAPDSTHSDYRCTIEATTVKIDGDIKQLVCDHNSLTALTTNSNQYSESISCLDNYLRGAAIDSLVASLPDRNAGTNSETGMQMPMGKLTVLQEGTEATGEPIIENNIITRKQVAAANAKRWEIYAVKYINGTSTTEVYSGADPAISMGGAKKAGDKIRVSYTIDGEYSISGATELPIGSGFYNYELNAETMTVAGVVTKLRCSHNSLRWLKVSDNAALEWLDCSDNAISGENMDSLISSLPDRIGKDSGTLAAIYTEGDANVCTTTQVAAAKAKNWDVKSIDYDRNLSDYAGSSGTVTGTERIADDENATIVAIYNVNGMKLAQPQRGLNIIKMSNGKVKKMFLKE